MKTLLLKKINWKSKPDNLRDAILEANVLPTSVVFIDDNPVERAAVKSNFPGVRVLEASHYLWRHILIRSSETQTPVISDESGRRTEMIRAQVVREATRDSLSQADFVASLNLEITIHRIDAVHNIRIPRVLELVNKTNQFNTNGARWKLEELADYFVKGGFCIAFDVKDKYTTYGLVGALLLREGTIEQFVMSCRVMGLGCEAAVLAEVSRDILACHSSVHGLVKETPANGPCRRIYEQNGWKPDGEGRWVIRQSNVSPNHIVIKLAE